MFKKIHPRGVILVPNLHFMWVDMLKQLQQFRPHIKKSMINPIPNSGKNRSKTCYIKWTIPQIFKTSYGLVSSLSSRSSASFLIYLKFW